MYTPFTPCVEELEIPPAAYKNIILGDNIELSLNKLV